MTQVVPGDPIFREFYDKHHGDREEMLMDALTELQALRTWILLNYEMRSLLSAELLPVESTWHHLAGRDKAQ